MTTSVKKSILVNVPVSRAYNQWTQFEDFPQFMSGVQSVKQLDDQRLEWVAQIAGVKRRWEARILEQLPDSKIAWAATSGATNAGAVTFEDVGGGQARVELQMEYEPEGVVENVAHALHIIDRQAEGDLERFKEFIESERYASGAWRGSINQGARTGAPTIADAGESFGDTGKAGLSGKAMAAGAVVAAAGVAAAVKAGEGKQESSGDQVADVPGTSRDPQAVDVIEVVEDEPGVGETDPATGTPRAEDPNIRRPI